MCQHYEHRAAESTIDLDSSHHMCRKLSENLLSSRCDHCERAPSTSGGDQSSSQASQKHSRRPRPPKRDINGARGATPSSRPRRACSPNGR